MANNKRLKEAGAGTRFSSTNQPKNSGRRPSVLAKYIRENRVSLTDIRATISSLIGYSADEIQKILEDKFDKPPVGIILIMKAITADIKKGDITNFEKLLDRAYGKPVQSVETNGHLDINQEIVDYSILSDEQLSEIIRSEKGTRKTRTKPPQP